MLTDMVVEEEFEIKEEEPWYDKQDLEHGGCPSITLKQAFSFNSAVRLQGDKIKNIYIYYHAI